MPTCPLCKSRSESRRISYTQSYEGRLYVVENVPAEVCDQCGEVTLDPATAKKIQELVWAGKPKATVELPVLDLAEAL